MPRHHNSSPYVQFHARLPKSLLNRFQVWADRSQRDVAEIIRFVLWQADESNFPPGFFDQGTIIKSVERGHECPEKKSA